MLRSRRRRLTGSAAHSPENENFFVLSAARKAASRERRVGRGGVVLQPPEGTPRRLASQAIRSS
jgi:hypothetical protein